MRAERPPVSIVDDLWLAALTRDENNAGSKSRFNLTVNLEGGMSSIRIFPLASGASYCAALASNIEFLTRSLFNRRGN
jgi:hypothetical protein